MSDSDVLARAAKALREAHSGEREGSGFTRARIMNSVHRQRRRHVLRWAVFSPLASLLLVGSAWAQSTGKWPVIWKAVASVFVAAPAPPEAGGAPRTRELPPPKPRTDAPAPDPALDAVVPEAVPVPEVVPEVPRVEPSAPPLPPPPRARRPRPKRKPVEAAEAPPRSEPTRAVEPAEEAQAPREPAHDRELGSFRAAHDLHFANRPREAIAAYAEYLRKYPNGRFVPEARYNGALDQIKLGNSAAAREALEPFAAGRYGTYRRKEARDLLDALP